MKVSFLRWVLNFYLTLCNVCSFAPFEDANGGYVGTRHGDSNPTWLPIPGGLDEDCQVLSVAVGRE